MHIVCHLLLNFYLMYFSSGLVSDNHIVCLKSGMVAADVRSDLHHPP